MTGWEVSAEPDGGDGVSSMRVHVNVVMLILTAVVLFSVAFEWMKERLMENLKDHLAEVVEVLFGELTLLGVIGLVIFLVAKSGGLSHLSTNVFGDGHEEELESTIEAVHYVLFFVMVLFLATVLSSLLLGTITMRKWRKMEVAAHHPGLVALDYARSQSRRSCNPLRLIEPSYEHLSVIYTSLRTEFISARVQALAPGGGHHGHHGRHGGGGGHGGHGGGGGSHEGMVSFVLDNNFDFSEYVGMILAHSLAEVVEIPPLSWMAILNLLLVVSNVAMMSDGTAMAVFFALGYAVPVVLFAFMVKCRWILRQLLHPGLFEYADQLKVRMDRNALDVPQSDLHVPLNPLTADPEASLDASVNSEFPGPSTEMWEAQKPPYTFRSIAPRRGWLGKLVLGPPPSKHEALFWFDRKGQVFGLFLIRLLTVFNSIYLAVFFAVVMPKVGDETTPGTTAILIIIGVVPSLAFFYTFPKILRLFTLVSSVEQLRHRKVITRVLRIMKTRQTLRALKMLLAMKSKYSLKGKRKSGGGGGGGSGAGAGARARSSSEAKADSAGSAKTRPRRAPVEAGERQARRREIQEAFNVFDQDGSGHILDQELGDLLASLGFPTTPDSVEQIIDELDSNQDGTIDFEEFFEWSLQQSTSSEADVTATVEQLFNLIDKDKSGGISVSELRSTLESLGESLTYEDTTEILREFDENDDGVISKEEFMEMLKKNIVP